MTKIHLNQSMLLKIDIFVLNIFIQGLEIIVRVLFILLYHLCQYVR
jgi:hypothetical protein